MALSFTSKIGGATRTRKLHQGLKFHHIEITLGATADYSSGIDLATNATKMGFSKIWGVMGVSVRTSANAQRILPAIYDQNTGKLRLYTVVAPVASAPTITVLGGIADIAAAHVFPNPDANAGALSKNSAGDKTGITGVQAPVMTNGVLVEVTAATHLAAGDIISAFVVGV